MRDSRNRRPRREDDDYDDNRPARRSRHDEDEGEDYLPKLRRGKSRAYIHRRCGGTTIVSDGDYQHICDPFWLCTGTYCCTCSAFVSLDQVRWADTDEPISLYRARLRGLTPLPLQLWQFGGGFVAGGIVGVVAGLLLALVLKVPPNDQSYYWIGGALGGAFIVYFLGSYLLRLVFGIDYTRMR